MLVQTSNIIPGISAAFGRGLASESPDWLFFNVDDFIILSANRAARRETSAPVFQFPNKPQLDCITPGVPC